MPSSLAIGDFSRATHLSVKTLRHYHQLGLLVPAEVDAGSGYRRYRTEQIPTAQVIRRFRALAMPLEEIGQVLGTTDLQARNQVIASHLARLEEELAETQASVASLRELLQGPEGPAATPVIAYRRDEEIQAATISEVVGTQDLGPWFQGAIGELYATLAGQDVGVAGPPGGVIADEFFAEEKGELTIFLPSVGPVRPVGRVRPRLLPAVELATVVHAGAHVDIDRSYGSLATFVSEHALAVDGPIRERYLVGRQDTADETAWRTEIGWPVFHTGPPAGEAPASATT